MPLLDHPINDLLVKLLPFFNQTCLDVTDITNVCVIHPLFQYAPHCTGVYSMIDWENCVVTPRPLLESLSIEELVHLVEVGPLSVPQIPCHTQAECDVTIVSTKVFGRAARHSMIVSSEKSRRQHKTLEAKKHIILPDQSINQSIIQSVNQSINQSVNQNTFIWHHMSQANQRHR